MKLILLFFVMSHGLIAQTAENPLVINTEKDVSKILSASDYVLIATTQTSKNHDPDKYLAEYVVLDAAIVRRLKEISERGLSPLEKDIRECLINHALSMNRRFKADDLRAYAVKFHNFSKERAESLKETDLISQLQILY